MHRIVLALALCPLAAWLAFETRDAMAVTRRVERDGSGDYLTIPQALALAQAGDVILLGPGRYTERYAFQVGGEVLPTHAGVRVGGLTIRGIDRDAVVIGPEEPYPWGQGPVGIATLPSVSSLRVESLTLENNERAMDVYGQLAVEGCTFNGNRESIISSDPPLLEARDCLFTGSSDGLILFGLTEAKVARCTFERCGYAVYAVFGGTLYLESCDIRLGSVGVYASHTDAYVQGNTFVDVSNVATVGYGSVGTVYVSDNEFRGGQVQLEVGGNAQVVATRNRFEGSTWASVLIEVSGRPTIYGNDLLPATGYAAYARWFQTGPIHLDVRNNYWGVNSAAEISALIYDGYDDPTSPGYFDFEPFVTQPVPAETESWGQLKALYAN